MARCGVPKSTGTRPLASASANSRSSVILIDMATLRRQLVLCLRNKGYEVSLERRKIYQVLPDRQAASHRQLRVIDESGEDRSEEHTSELQSQSNLVCRLLLE